MAGPVGGSFLMFRLIQLRLAMEAIRVYAIHTRLGKASPALILVPEHQYGLASAFADHGHVSQSRLFSIRVFQASSLQGSVQKFREEKKSA